MPSSCSHWWHAPVYIAATVALIVAAISSSSSKPPPPDPPFLNATSSPNTRAGDLSSDAILALRRAGFHLTAAILQVSRPSLLPASRPATVFAVPDAALSPLSFSAARRLFLYHVVPLRLPLSDLAKMPRGRCLPTLLKKPLVLTAASSDGPDRRAVSINGVPISLPGIFVRGPHAVHGVAAQLHRFDGRDPPPAAICGSEKVAAVPWDPVVRALGARGYVSFSVGLSAVLDAVARGPQAPDQVTVFAPKGSGFDHVAGPATTLEAAVRRHVAVGRFGYRELAAMHVGEEMGTLAEEEGLRITDGGRTGLVAINGVEVTEPEVYVGDGVVVHGIATAFGDVSTVT